MLSTTNDPIQHYTQYLYNEDGFFAPAAEPENTKNQEETKTQHKEVTKDICVSPQAEQTGLHPFSGTTDQQLMIPLENISQHEISQASFKIKKHISSN